VIAGGVQIGPDDLARIIDAPCLGAEGGRRLVEGVEANGRYDPDGFGLMGITKTSSAPTPSTSGRLIDQQATAAACDWFGVRINTRASSLGISPQYTVRHVPRESG
jgi:hypothetical protein